MIKGGDGQMAGYSYESRRKLTEAWLKEMKNKEKQLSNSGKRLFSKLCDSYGLYGADNAVDNEMRHLLQHGTYWKLSDLYRDQYQDAVDVCVDKALQADFYYALDELNCYQMTAGWFRRSMRSRSYIPFVAQSIRLLQAYARLDFYGGDLADVLTGKIAPELYDHARNETFDYAGILAAQIDRGDEKTIQAVKDILFGESNTLMMSRELVLGIVMSKSEALYEDLGKFLLAARLQEGARQVVCETMDAGRPEAFLHLFSVIEENNLIRYSSVRRAVGTWIGIFHEKSADRVSEKLLRLMGQCLRDDTFAKEQLAANDAVAISCALWAKGFYNADDAVEAVRELIQNGTRQQKMTASYFLESLQDAGRQMRAARDVIFSYPEDMELAACFMPYFMAETSACFHNLIKDESRCGYDVSNDKAIRPKSMMPEEMFRNREEAERAYVILRGIMERMPKKGLTISPCIFPWHEVTMRLSDIAMRMCLIAWMLQDEALMDEAALLIPMIGPWEGYAYSGISRALVARVLLYRPKSEIRKKVLFELLHNAEEYTNRAAYRLVEALDLSSEDYRQIEKNLKYKKGRKETLNLLRKQDKKELALCIGRLLAEKSEECHMGALDLALQLKQEDKTVFATILPQLQAFCASTGKEQVLLKELIGAQSEAQDILNTPGYGLYDVNKDWILPPVNVDESKAETIFQYGEEACARVLRKLDKLIDDNRERTYTAAWNDEEMMLGNWLDRIRRISYDAGDKPLDAYPFPELWEEFYAKEIGTPELLIETKFFFQCCEQRRDYEQNIGLYQQIFHRTFADPGIIVSYAKQVHTALSVLSDQYVPKSLQAQYGLCGMAKLLSLIDTSRAVSTGDVLELPVFGELFYWLLGVRGDDWESSFALRFRLSQYYLDRQDQRQQPMRALYRHNGFWVNYVELSDYVQCYVRGIWDKDLFYKAVFAFCGLGSVLEPISAVEQKGAVSPRKAGRQGLTAFFGWNRLRPVDGKYHFDTIGDEMPEMMFAHELYREVIPVILKVELKRGEQPTLFSQDIHQIYVIYGISYMIQILTALGKDPLQRGYSYYASDTERKQVLCHLLKVCMPKPEETAKDLKKALRGTDITKKRLVELAMYAQQWIPMIEEYLEMPGFASTCYYFMAHTSECFDEQITSMIAKYTPLSTEELINGAFDIQWFFEAYGKLGEKNFKLLYDAAKYSATGTAHARARRYADAALGNVDKEALKAEIQTKRNKDLLMSIGLLPLPATVREREEELLDRYQFIQKYKKESSQFGAQRRASEAHAAETALRNLSVNAGFTDVMRLMLRMEGKLTEQSAEYFDWKAVDEIELMIYVDENGKSALQCRKDGRLLKSIPAKYKKDETVLQYQAAARKLKEQYSRTRQMMEQAMEDRTAFAVWEFLELFQNPVAGPITRPLVVRTADAQDAKMGFLTADGIMDAGGQLWPVEPDDPIYIAHPYDLYRSGHWHVYQKLLFDKQMKQPFKQVFRELYVKLDEELEKQESRLFAGNQIQPQKAAGALRGRRWVADYEEGLQKIYYKENIIACIYAMADWFSPSDVEAPTLEYVVFSDRKTGETLKIKDVPDIIYSEVMRDVDLAVSVAHAGGVDPETSHSTIEMRRAIVACNLALFQTKNVRLEGSHAVIDGKLGQYTVHLGSGVVHQMGNAMLFVVPVHSQSRGRIFLPFVDEDPKTAEIMSKILLFAEDTKIKDPKILRQIQL